MEVPDFKSYEPNYTEENRRDIKKFYEQMADASCSVIFDFEMPASKNEFASDMESILAHCVKLRKRGLNIECVKYYKENVGCSLTEAMAVVGPASQFARNNPN